MVNLLQHLLTRALRGYQVMVSPALTAMFGPMGLGCRYEPTCSQYAIEAVRLHGACRGAVLAGKRLCRCHPWSGFGLDPVPPRGSSLDLSASPLSPLISRRNGS